MTSPRCATRLSRTPPIRALVLVAILVGVVGGYRSHRLVDDAGICPLPSLPLVRWEEPTDPGSCVLFGNDREGHTYRGDCTTTSCTLTIDGGATCTCGVLDYGNTCSDGIPTCVDWPIFDFGSP